MLYQLFHEGVCVQHALQDKPCRAVLCCAVLCCAVLCCAVNQSTCSYTLSCIPADKLSALNLSAGCSKRRSVLPTSWNRWHRSQDHVKAWSQHAAHVPSPDTPQGTPPRRAAAGRYAFALPCPVVRLYLVVQMIVPKKNSCKHVH